MQAMRNRLSFWLFDDTGTVFFCFFVFHQLNPHLLHSNKILKKGEKKIGFKKFRAFLGAKCGLYYVWRNGNDNIKSAI